ncbi:hypothetical protein Acsp03_71470 [Actinomadura sp. NBRC 104412]|nr:hypothetical protein Acsp03_71470 [Actinomadura sp. NBRC 104412]
MSGDADTVTRLAERLAEHFEVLGVSAPYSDRSDPGDRRYLLINYSRQADGPGPA